MVRLEHAARRHVVGRPAHQPRRQHRPVSSRSPTSSPSRRNCSAAKTFRSPCRYPLRSADAAVAAASTSPGSTRCWSTSTAHPTTAHPPASTTPASCCRCSGCRPSPRPTRRPTRCRRRRARHLQTRAAHHAVAAGRPAAAGARRAGRHHPGAADRRRPGRPRWPPAAGSTSCCPPPSSPPARRRPRRRRSRSALCLAVDPDLLVTVNAMTGGYVVDDAPDAGPGTPTHPGTGQDAAVELAQPAAGRWPSGCAWRRRPYAQADLDALQRVGDPGLSAIATNGAGDIVDQILGVTSTRGATLVGDGPLTGRGGRAARRRRARPSRSPPPTCAAQDSAHGEPATADVAPRRLHAASGGRAVRPDRRRRAGRARAPIPSSPSYLDPSLDVPAQARLGGRAPPGRAGLAAVARPATARPSRAPRS